MGKTNGRIFELREVLPTIFCEIPGPNQEGVRIRINMLVIDRDERIFLGLKEQVEQDGLILESTCLIQKILWATGLQEAREIIESNPFTL